MVKYAGFASCAPYAVTRVVKHADFVRCDPHAVTRVVKLAELALKFIRIRPTAVKQLEFALLSLAQARREPANPAYTCICESVSAGRVRPECI